MLQLKDWLLLKDNQKIITTTIRFKGLSFSIILVYLEVLIFVVLV